MKDIRGNAKRQECDRNAAEMRQDFDYDLFVTFPWLRDCFRVHISINNNRILEVTNTYIVTARNLFAAKCYDFFCYIMQICDANLLTSGK